MWRWRDIRCQAGDYLDRLYLFRCPWFQLALHWINHPDADEAPHNHPRPFLSIILWGWYEEVSGYAGIHGRHTFGPWRRRWFSLKSRSDYHRIVSAKRGTVTLVLFGPAIGGADSWGFLDDGGEHVHWRRYVDQRRLG